MVTATANLEHNARSLRRSRRLQNPEYRARTTWDLPRIVSGVAPSSSRRSSIRRHRLRHSITQPNPYNQLRMPATSPPFSPPSTVTTTSTDPSSAFRPMSSREENMGILQPNNVEMTTIDNHAANRPSTAAEINTGQDPVSNNVRNTSQSNNSAAHHTSATHLAPSEVENVYAANPLFCIARRPPVDSYSPIDVGHMNVVCPFCHALHWPGERVLSSSVSRPEFDKCCAHGKVSLSALRVPPLPIYNLYVNDDAQGKEFRKNIVQYNAALAFTSMGVKIDQSVLGGGGPPVFRIHGKLTHLAGSLLPEPGVAPAYAQLYVYDTEAAAEYRMSRNSNLRRDTMEALQSMLTTNNCYSRIYQHAYEVLQNCDAPDCSMRLCVRPGNDPRRYNEPTANEVGVILPGENESIGDYRDIVVYLRPQYFHSETNNRNQLQLHRINEGHPSYAPLHYVLLFPFGDPGWFHDMKCPGNRRRVTLLQYAAYRIHPRNDEFSTILRGGRLFQRYLVDMFACIDQERLRFIRNQQSRFRVSVLSGIEDAISANDDRPNLSQLGQKIILPSSYRGGPCQLHQQYLDGMAVARHFKKIDIFLTMTANPNWPEITRELLPGQTAADRPDLVARVFQLKKKALLRAIVNDGIFGPCVAHVYCIEFQKRGLPHMHLLIFLQDEYKMLSPEIVDSIIWARWPDPTSHPRLFELVKKHMVHGPCGALKPNAPCMKDGKCTRGYPKPFRERTTMDENGYPHYFRPNDGRAYMVGGFLLDNRYIVPYSPFCTLYVESHVNVECVISFASMKYLNKYMDKGSDCGTLSIYGADDEVKQYIDGRYFSASEAAWRIFQFELHGIHPNVVRLQVHLPEEQHVLFQPDDKPEQVVQSAHEADTSLTVFFKTNQLEGKVGNLARSLTYQQFPNHFTLRSQPNNSQSKMWSRRQRKDGFALGRMNYVGPTAGEHFYLRTLLMVVRGATSFEDLRIVNGILCPTFHEACLRRGLLEDDQEWRLCMSDAADVQTGPQLHHLFTSIIQFCEPANPRALWNEFRDRICDDVQHRLITMGRTVITAEDAYDFGLYLIDQILHDSGHSLSDYHLPMFQRHWSEDIENRLISEQRNYNRELEGEMAQNQLGSLYRDQQVAFDKVWSSITNHTGKVFFVDGWGGTGKTYLYQTLCHAVRAQGLIIICVASTGLACLLLPGGKTAHSTFKIPIDNLDADSVCNIPKESVRADLLQAADAIIYDECLMTHRHCFEALDRTFQDLRDCPDPFGGLTVVFGGDFQQILPVVEHGDRAEIVGASLQKSYLWSSIEVLRLRENMRLQNAPEEAQFAQWLLQVGHSQNMDCESYIELPPNMVTYEEEQLISFIYGDMFKMKSAPPPEYFLDRNILAPRNDDVRETNEKILEKMNGETLIYHSADSVEQDTDDGVLGGNRYGEYPEDFLRSLDPASLPPSELKLKLGCPLILLRNLDPNKGLCNGTRMILLHAYPRILEVLIIGGDHNGEKAFIPRIVLKPSTKQYAFTLKRRQFPVRLCFAMTINKAQGQSLKHVGIHLLSSVFCHGQLYVALSRATSCHRIKILLPKTAVGLQRKTLNVVYPEVLVD